MLEHAKRQVKVSFLSRNALIFLFVYYRNLLFRWPKLKQELVSAITPIGSGLLASTFKTKGMKHGMKMIWTAKIPKLNEEMTPHCLILSCLPKMLVSFVSLPSQVSPPHPPPTPPPPHPARRTDRVRGKGGVTVRSSPLPSPSATSCFAVSYFYSVVYSVKHCFLSPIFKKVFR